MPRIGDNGSEYASNDQRARDDLADHHVRLGTHINDLGLYMQSVNADWNGPAADAFEAFKKALAHWCAAGQVCFDGVGKAHSTINQDYSQIANSGSTSMSTDNTSN